MRDIALILFLTLSQLLNGATTVSRTARVETGDVPDNVKWKGATGDGLTDDTLSISNAFKSLPNGGNLLFPPGTYRYTSAIVLEGKTNVTINGYGATLYDVGQLSLLEDTTQGRVPVGWKITNCENVTLRGFIHDGAVSNSTPNLVVSSSTNRVPHIDIQLCRKVKVEDFTLKAKSGPLAYPTNGEYSGVVMNALYREPDCYFRIIDSKDVTVRDLTLASGCGDGEIIITRNCENVVIDGLYYHQNGATTFPWTLGRVIGCTNVSVSKMRCSLQANGYTLFSLNGKNITAYDCHVDAPNHYIFGVSPEGLWRYTDCENITIRDSTTTGVAPTIVDHTEPGNNPLYVVRTNKGLTIDNVQWKRTGLVVPLATRAFETATLRNLRIHNYQYLTYNAPNPRIDVYLNHLLTDSVITADLSVNPLSTIDTHGLMKINNTKIDMGGGTFSLRDRAIDTGFTNTLAYSTNWVELNNCDINNTVLKIWANTRVNNCRFYNSLIEIGDITYTHQKYPTVSFKGCNFEYVTNNPTLTIDNCAIMVRNMNKISVDNCSFTGQVWDTLGNSLFNFQQSTNLGGTFNVFNSKFDVNRYVTASSASRPMILFLFNNTLNRFDATVEHCAFTDKSMLCAVLGDAVGAVTDYSNLKFLNNTLRGGFGFSFDIVEGNPDTVNMLFSGNMHVFGITNIVSPPLNSVTITNNIQTTF